MDANFWNIVSAVATSVAATFTAVAAVVAILAMAGWKKQDKLKAYQRYKMSVVAFKTQLTMLPSDFSEVGKYSNDSNEQQRQIAISGFVRCCEAWAAYSVFDVTTEEQSAWNNVYSAANGYIYYGDGRKNEMAGILLKAERITPKKNSIYMKIKFIFRRNK